MRGQTYQLPYVPAPYVLSGLSGLSECPPLGLRSCGCSAPILAPRQPRGDWLESCAGWDLPVRVWGHAQQLKMRTHLVGYTTNLLTDPPETGMPRIYHQSATRASWSASALRVRCHARVLRNVFLLTVDRPHEAMGVSVVPYAACHHRFPSFI